MTFAHDAHSCPPFLPIDRLIRAREGAYTEKRWATVGIVGKTGSETQPDATPDSLVLAEALATSQSCQTTTRAVSALRILDQGRDVGT